MKRKISIILVLVLALSAFPPSAFAVETNETNQEEGWIITAGGSVSYVDENGQSVVEELDTSSEFVPADDVSQGSMARAMQTKTITHVDRFLNDDIQCTLTAKFNYESGYKVTGKAENFSVVSYNANYDIYSKRTSVTTGSNDRWCRVLLKVVVIKPSGDSAICNTWIECTWAGGITTS